MTIDLSSLAWYLCITLGFISLAEIIGMQLFLKPIYNLGFKAYSEFLNLPNPSTKKITTEIIKMNEGKFKFINSSECLFTSRWHFLEWRTRTPFPFKGRVVWSDNGAEIIGKLPIGTTLFFLFFLIGWTAGIFYGMPITALIAGWVFIIIIALFIPTEKRRMKEMIEELKLILTQ